MASGSNWIGAARLQHLRATGPVEQADAPRRREELSRLTGLSVTFLNEAIRPGISIVADQFHGKPAKSLRTIGPCALK